MDLSFDTYGIIGNPIKYSFSSRLHRYIFSEINKNAHYNSFLVDESDLEKAINGAHALNIKGLNVTSPFKEEVIKYLYMIDDLAKIVGSVNTIKYDISGYVGYNTDIKGIEDALKLNDIDICGKDVLLLGSGGSSRSIGIICGIEGVRKLYIANRTISKADTLKDYLQSNFDLDIETMTIDTIDRIDRCDIVINSTTLGFGENIGKSAIENKKFFVDKGIGVAFDLIYSPAETMFLTQAKSAGVKCINGFDMLFYQGIAADEIWFDMKFSDKQKICMKEYLSRIYSDGLKTDKNIVLIGFMGVGKSLFSRKLSKKLNRNLIDMDKMIERKVGISIEEIFKKHGEEYFREVEKRVCSEISQSRFSIISTGGGVVKYQENIMNLRQNSIIVYINSPISRISRNLEDSKKSRPLLETNSLEDLVEQRKMIYERCCDISVKIDGFDIDKNMNLILEAIYEKVEGY